MVTGGAAARSASFNNIKNGGKKMGEKVIKSKRTSYGLIEVRESGVLGWYALYINGELKEQSADKDYILKQYDKY